MEKKNLPGLSCSKMTHGRCILLRTAREIGWLMIHLGKRVQEDAKGACRVEFPLAADWLEK